MEDQKLNNHVRAFIIEKYFNPRKYNKHYVPRAY
uniref:ORF15 n=1 Tax=Nitrosopumilaceae spindle-shaped virus TaxID=3065433 RepID=A0AAT9JFJ8_9VIRU